jgi:hypothetical protein
MDQPRDRFRSSTLGWIRGTLAGWGTIVLAIAGVLLTGGPWSSPASPLRCSPGSG